MRIQTNVRHRENTNGLSSCDETAGVKRNIINISDRNE